MLPLAQVEDEVGSCSLAKNLGSEVGEEDGNVEAG